MIHQKACARLVKSCYPYLKESEEAGRYYLQSVRMMKVQKNKELLKLAIMEYEKAVLAEDEDKIDKANEKIAKFEERLESLDEFKDEV